METVEANRPINTKRTERRSILVDSFRIEKAEKLDLVSFIKRSIWAHIDIIFYVEFKSVSMY